MKTTIILLILSFQIAQSQHTWCDYIPLEFEEVNPTWEHLVIDSTFIGHVDTSLETGAYKQYYLDGMDQLAFDGGSFVNDGYLYSITEVDYDLDLAGYYIEKINLETSETVWKIQTDLRFEEHREKSLGVKIENGKFIMFGVRTFTDELTIGYVTFHIGLIPSVFFIREYNAETGELIRHFTPSAADENTAIINSNSQSEFFYENNDKSFDYISIKGHIERGIFVVRNKIDENGELISEKDTVINALFNHINYKKVFFKLSKKQFHKNNEGDYYFLEQIMPLPDSNIERRGIITKYDKNFNQLAFWDIAELNIPNFSLLHFAKEIDDKIIVKGCLNTHPEAICEMFFIILDKDLNYINRITAKHNDKFLKSIANKTILFNENEQMVVFDRVLNEEGHSYLNIYQSNDSGTMDSLQRLTIKEEEWVGFVDSAIQLDNGDYLVKINHSCYIDGAKRSWHPVWMRLAKEDVETLSATSDLAPPSAYTIFPNPTTDDLNISVTKGFSGQLVISDVTGKILKVKEQKHGTTQLKMDVNLLRSGAYFLTLKNEKSGMAETLRFVKL